MIRYILKYSEDQYIKFIQWTSGVFPHPALSHFDQAMIVDKEYLTRKIEKTNRSRWELIFEYYPNVELLEVEVTIKKQAKVW